MDDDKPPPTVLLSNRQDLTVDGRALEDLARRVLTEEGARGTELSVSFVDEEEIADLHLRYMDEPGPTDVLSFPLDGEEGFGERDDAGGEGVRLLGDVVICPAYASRANPDLDAEVRLLLVHGILHLLGYDHEEDRERRAMWERQERYTGVRVP